MPSYVTYINRYKDIYYFRKCASGRGKGTQVVATKNCPDDALEKIPRGLEIVESPNGRVSCRKKLKSAILPAEFRLLKSWAKKLSEQAHISVELKKNSLVVHSATKKYLSTFALPFDFLLDHILLQQQNGRQANSNSLAGKRELPPGIYEPAFLFTLTNPSTRTFTVQRMCYMSDMDGEWMSLQSGQLEELAEKYLPHLEKISFFDLF